MPVVGGMEPVQVILVAAAAVVREFATAEIPPMATAERTEGLPVEAPAAMVLHLTQRLPEVLVVQPINRVLAVAGEAAVQCVGTKQAQLAGKAAVAVALAIPATPVAPVARQTRPLLTLCQWSAGRAILLPLPPADKLTFHGTRNK